MKIYQILDECVAEDIVQVKGWILRKRNMGNTCFMIIRDGTGTIQIAIKRDDNTKERLSSIMKESSVTVTGKIVIDNRAPGGKEIHVENENLVIVGNSKPIIQVNTSSNTHALFENRHLVLREERLTNVLKLRYYIDELFRKFFRENNLIGVTPPTITGQQVEGGSTLFNVPFYKEKGYLTQSSQLYLESVLATFGNVYCIMPSYRAEKSATRRHLSEFTHVEAELSFITFEELLDFIERMIRFVVNTLIDEHGKLVEKLNPGFKKLDNKPFTRMTYATFIQELNDAGYLNPKTNMKYNYGDDVTESVERKFIDNYGKPVFITRFPTKMKAFYMEPCKDNKDETYSTDLLLPNVGEVVGGSMRIWDYKELENKLKENNLKVKDYKWYTDQRIYGTVPHGGFGLGMERLIMWITGQDHVKDCCLYPRFMGRLVP